MTSAHRLLRAVAGFGGIVRLHDGNLRVAAPRPLPDDLRNGLREHKAEIVALLLAGPVDASSAPPPVRQSAPSFDAVFDAFGLDPLLDQDRSEAVRIWMGMAARGPPG
ncbi:MAG: hypothetical protein HQL37_14055 [Alphaproteobacteria bacterium]|nr:hypothetical protein [Alphaproteobacteria bacterium]